MRASWMWLRPATRCSDSSTASEGGLHAEEALGAARDGRVQSDLGRQRLRPSSDARQRRHVLVVVVRGTLALRRRLELGHVVWAVSRSEATRDAPSSSSPMLPMPPLACICTRQSSRKLRAGLGPSSAKVSTSLPSSPLFFPSRSPSLRRRIRPRPCSTFRRPSQPRRRVSDRRDALHVLIDAMSKPPGPAPPPPSPAIGSAAAPSSSGSASCSAPVSADQPATTHHPGRPIC